MAQVKHAGSDRVATLGHLYIVGRSADADLRIDNPQVSAQHATLRWVATGWELKDLGSHNGTVVDGRRIEPGVWTSVHAQMVLCFGAPQERWIFLSTDAPQVTVTRLDTMETLVGEHGYLDLSPLGTSASLGTEDGHDYYLDIDGSRTRVEDRATVDIGAVAVRLSLPPREVTDSQTITAEEALSPRTIAIDFVVSRDEEHVQINLVHSYTRTAMRSRSFDYMLLELGRARLADATANEIPNSEHGWVYTDTLASALGVSPSHLNVDVYRARRHFEAAGVTGTQTIIERRASSKEIRLGLAGIVIS